MTEICGRGRISKIFNLPNDLGLSNYLSSLDTNGNHINERMTQFINDTEIKNLNVITAGNVPPNPSELLATEKIDELMKELKIFYDIIIFDTVSILEAPEASILANASDLVLMMSSYGNTKIEEFTKAYEKIKDIQDVMVGMGLNKIPDRKLKKKLANVKIRWKHWTHKALGKMSVYWKKLKQLLKNFRKVGVVVAFVGSMLVAGAMLLRKCLVSCGNKLKLKSQDVKYGEEN